MTRFWRPSLSEGTAASLVLGIVVIIPFLLSFNPYYVSIFISALILGGVSIAWNLLAGVCGQVSFGHAAFFGIGAYASAILVTKVGWEPYVAIVGGGVCGAVGSLIIGIPAFRLRGPYLCPCYLRLRRGREARNYEHDLAYGRIAGNHEHSTPSADSFGFLDAGFPHFKDHKLLHGRDDRVRHLPHGLFHPPLQCRLGNVSGPRRRRDSGRHRRACGPHQSVGTGGFSFLHRYYGSVLRSLRPLPVTRYGFRRVLVCDADCGIPLWGMQTLIGPVAGALVITGLDEFVFKRFFETGHKLFFGLLLAVVIVWAPTGLLGNRVRRIPHGEKK